MAYNNFYSNFGDQIFFEKKVLSQSIYGKHYIRNNLLTNVIQIDNSINFSNLVVTTPLFVGFSFYNKNFIFRHRFNKHFKINSFLNVSNCINVPRCLRLYQSFQALQLINRVKFKKQMFLLSSRKGGFTVYSVGVKGFLPRSHAVFFFQNFFKKRFHKNKKITLARLSFFMNSQHVVNKYFPFKIPFYKIKLTFTPNSIVKFSGRIIQKKWSLTHKLRVVFLSVNPKEIEAQRQLRKKRQREYRKKSLKFRKAQIKFKYAKL